MIAMMNSLYSSGAIGFYVFVTNWGKTGLGLGERLASETGSTDDGLLGCSITDTIR